jgi:type I restriction enzyme S subunit
MKWQLTTLGEAYDVRDGTHDSPKYQETGYPLITSKNLKPAGLNYDKVKYISDTDFKKINERSAVHKGDVLFAMIGTIGNPIVVEIEANFAIKNVALFKVPETQNEKFLKYYLESKYVIEKMIKEAKGTTQKFVGLGYLRGFPIALPPLPEQKRIVALLDTVFADLEQTRAKTEQNLKNARELFEIKKLNLFESLGDSSNLSPLPLVCDNIFAGGDAPKKGLFSKEKTKEFNIPIYANAVKNNGLYGFTDYSRANKPSITIAARGSGTGHIELRKEPFLPIVRLIVLTPNKEIIGLEYLMHALQTLDILRSGSAIPQLTVPMIKEYSIPIPDMITQEKIVSELESLKRYIEKIEAIYNQKLIAIDELKKSILQKAFSGELTQY